MLFDKSWPVLVLWERRRQNNGQARGGEERRTRAAQETREAQGTRAVQGTRETRGTEAVQGMREAQGTRAAQETQNVRHAAVQLLASDLGYTILETDSCTDAWELFCERADFSCVILIPDEKCGSGTGVSVPCGSAAGGLNELAVRIAAENDEIPVFFLSAQESEKMVPENGYGVSIIEAGDRARPGKTAADDGYGVSIIEAGDRARPGKTAADDGYGVSIIEAGDGAGPGKTGTHGVKLREGMRGASGGRSVFSGSAGAAADYLSARIQRYIGQACPKFLRRLIDYAEKNKYAWHTPGHMGGAGFLRAPAGAAFYKYFGKNTLRSDLSVSVAELGSLLDHSGVTGEAEQNSAEVFGADRTYYVLNGTSSSNQIIWSSQVGEGDLALLDRNCHKSLSYAVICTGARPLYMIPRRSRRGLIGPVPLSEFTESVIKERIEISASAQRNREGTAEKRGGQENGAENDKSENRTECGVPESGGTENVSESSGTEASVPEKRDVIAMMALTNSTYDGLCYNVRTILDALPQWVQRVHFDEAWFAYAAFHPIYRNHFGLIRTETEEDAYRPLIFCSQSTHKLLTALSQSSMLHIRNGSRLRVNPAAFNEAYMMYASTSPQYSMIASLDTATEMMKKDGFRLSHRMICGAIELRKELARRARRAREALENRETGKNGESRQGTERKQEDFRRNGNNWAFGIWQPEWVEVDGQRILFEEADTQYLASHQEPWVLSPEEGWHGFEEIEQDYVMLDPIKLTVTTPGLAEDGSMQEFGVPAPIVARFLTEYDIVCEKADYYSFLMLNSLGTDRVKQEAFLEALDEFRLHFEENTPLRDILPGLARAFPKVWGQIGLAEHCRKMHSFFRENEILKAMNQACSRLPEPAMTPSEAYREIVGGRVEQIELREAAERICASMIAPYPPGIPLIMGGEILRGDSAVYRYLELLERFENEFPGYGNEIHGVEKAEQNGKIVFLILCLER